MTSNKIPPDVTPAPGRLVTAEAVEPTAEVYVREPE